MIYSVHGKLIAKEPAMAVVECGGVGYACRTTLHTLGQVGNLGETVLLYTVMSVREDAVELFGFSTQQELQCFQLLTSVSGVGPKAALSILSDLTPDQFLLTVASGDSKALTRAKGIGAKSAQRIVMELKDKIAGDATGAALRHCRCRRDCGGDPVRRQCGRSYRSSWSHWAIPRAKWHRSWQSWIRPCRPPT